MPKVTSILDDLKTSKWSIIFYDFYSSFSLHDSLENDVSEYLEWLKFQKVLEDPPTNPRRRKERLQPPDFPAVL